MTSSISSKGQVTIPVAIREQLQLSTGTAVEFIVTDEGDVLLRKRYETAEPLRGYLAHRAPGSPIGPEEMDAAIGGETVRLHGGDVRPRSTRKS